MLVCCKLSIVSSFTSSHTHTHTQKQTHTRIIYLIEIELKQVANLLINANASPLGVYMFAACN